MGQPAPVRHLLECRPPSEAPLFMFGDIRSIARRAYGTREPLRVVNEKSRLPSHSVVPIYQTQSNQKSRQRARFF